MSSSARSVRSDEGTSSQVHINESQEFSNDRALVVSSSSSRSSYRASFFSVSLIMLTAFSSAAYMLSGGLMGTQTSLDPTDYFSRIDRLLNQYPLIDGHNDLVYLIRVELKNAFKTNRFTLGQGLLSHTDIPKMRKGKLGGQFWSLYIPCPEKTDYNDPDNTVRDTVEQVDTAHRLFQEYPETFQYCETAACARKVFKSGKIASLLGAEGLHQVGNSLGVIRKFYDLGLRYITLTHNCNNVFATAWNTVANGQADYGLTDFGKDAVLEMNRLGMLVDLSHVSHQTMRDVLSVSKSPVIFSHTDAYTLAPFFRNAPDDVLRQTASNGGVVMVAFIQRFLTPDDRKATVKDVADHILHIVSVTGSWDHVGIGGDYDGTLYLPDGLEDVSKYPNLFIELMKRGATELDLVKLAGENILRVLEANERNNKIFALSQEPSESYWKDRVWKQDYYGIPYMFSDSPQTRIISEKGIQSKSGSREEV